MERGNVNIEKIESCNNNKFCHICKWNFHDADDSNNDSNDDSNGDNNGENNGDSNGKKFD